MALGRIEATNVTNCFATVDTGWYPIAYVLYPGENVTGHGNYYIDYIENSDDSDGEVNSFFKNE